jgi:hypothetical protein
MILENLNKNNLTNILLVIGLIFIFHLYWKLPTRECMANLDDTQKSEVKQLIYETYKIDVNSIKNLSRIADDLVKSGLQLVAKNLIFLYNKYHKISIKCLL